MVRQIPALRLGPRQPATRLASRARSSCVGLVALGLIVGGLNSSLPSGADEHAIPGFSQAAADLELGLEDKLATGLDAASVERHFRYLTEEPHVAGSERNLQLAIYTADWFRRYGLEEVQIHEYEVLLPYPRHVSVELLEPIEFRPTLTEAGYAVDKDSWASEDVGITYLGMSASGDATAELIYAFSGNPEDYDWLESQGIDPAGKIAIVRYSLPYSYRGFKAWEAQRRGVKALILYSDPMEDGYRKGEVFPHGPWGPASHLQRGAITYDFIVPGDPLTPGWASVEGARRIPLEEAQSVPGIMAVPMSWEEAKPLLENLGGPVAPHSWQGALPITYRVGPGPSKVRVRVEMDGGSRSIQVVTGKILGSEEPDRLVVLGNHRDAWVYGAVDPSSGSATLLETARVLGKMVAEGHRPKRSLLLASWDAEEWHLTGSTEWGEHFARELGTQALAYLNVDGSVSGPDFEASAVASLDSLIESVARDVIDPNSRRSLLDTWRARQGLEGEISSDQSLVANDLGSGSDYTVFLNFLGIPIVSMSFEGAYGVYHSQYDNFYWMSQFGDPGFRYMTAMVEVWARMALRLANAEIYPYDFRSYSETVLDFLGTFDAVEGADENLDLGEAIAAAERWQTAATDLRDRTSRTLSGDSAAAGADLEAINNLLLSIERQFLLEEGIPGRPWFKHMLYAPRYTYAAMSLPGVREAAETGDWQAASHQLDLLTERLGRITEMTLRAIEQLSSTTAGAD